MLTALLDDKTEFVELFLQNGLSMREFLSPQILCQLYAGVSHFSNVRSKYLDLLFHNTKSIHQRKAFWFATRPRISVGIPVCLHMFPL